jgi:hypothetical protein
MFQNFNMCYKWELNSYSLHKIYGGGDVSPRPHEVRPVNDLLHPHDCIRLVVSVTMENSTMIFCFHIEQGN